MDAKKTRRAVLAAVDATADTFGGVLRLVVRILSTFLLVGVTTGILFACLFAYYVKTNLSTDLGVTLSDFSVSLSSKIVFLDELGREQELVTLSSDVNRIWVDYEDIPIYLQQAAVAIEDKRFYEHQGVDWYRTAGAFVNMFIGMKNDFGGSTLTQQLIKNTTGNDDATVQRKLLEIFQALQLERDYTKEDIMEWYLNFVFFGERANGVYAAAQIYFDKEPGELSLSECASIIGITNNPSLYSPYASAGKENNLKRRDIILYEMYDQGYITYAQYTQAKDEVLVFARAEGESYEQEIYSYYVDTIVKDVYNDLRERLYLSKVVAERLLYSGGLTIYACIDMRMQNLVDSLYEDPSLMPQPYYKESSQPLQSGIVILDPYTGEIKALSGGIGEKTRNSGWNNATDTRRPAGSSFKPISVYGPAFDLGLITQPTLVNDAPNSVIQLTGTSWYPRNADGGYSGVVTIRQALISSINTVAAQIMDLLRPAESYIYITERLGFELVEEDRNYAPLALGQLTNGVTVREMAQAFSAFVNDGIFTYARSYSLVKYADGTTAIDNSPQTITAFKPDTAWNLTDMLAAAATYGTGYEASFGYGKMPVAGKTGTSSYNEDRWFVGYTPYYLAAVWTGYDTPEAMYFSGNPAAAIWKKIMEPLHENLEIIPFPTPAYGMPTNVFGDVRPSEPPEETEEPEETEKPEETPAATPTPTRSPGPSPTRSPVPGAPPPATHRPENTPPPGSEPPVASEEPQEPTIENPPENGG